MGEVIAQLRERLKARQQEVQDTTRKQLAEYLAAEEEAARKRWNWNHRCTHSGLLHNGEIARRNPITSTDART